MTETICQFCSKPYRVAPYRIKKGLTKFCSYSCRANFRLEHCDPFWKEIPQETLVLIKVAYEQGTNTLTQISNKFGVARVTISRYAKLGNWHRIRRTEANRTVYRNLAQKILGRKLEKNEHVHHIDGNNINNIEANLHVFPNSRTHQEAHKSIERCAFELFSRNVIQFNHETGKYYIVN